jgi:hypothetical protein
MRIPESEPYITFATGALQLEHCQSDHQTPRRYTPDA